MCLRLDTPWCYRNTYFNTSRLLHLLSTPRNVLSAKKSSAAVSSATNLELRKLKHKQNQTWKQRIEHWQPIFPSHKAQESKNWEQLHSLSKHLIKWGRGEEALKAWQETAESRDRAQLELLFAAVLKLERQGTEAERIPGFNGVAVLTASRLQLCSPAPFLMAECGGLAQQHPENSPGQVPQVCREPCAGARCHSSSSLCFSCKDLQERTLPQVSPRVWKSRTKGRSCQR